MVPPYWLLAVLGPALVLGQAYDFGFKIMGPLWNNNTQVVVGRLPLRPDGSVPLRLEIRELMKDQYKWDLFILAMNTIQYMDQDDLLSFYQLAGKSNAGPLVGGKADLAYRNPWGALRTLEQCWTCRWRGELGILHSQLCFVSYVASTILGPVRGEQQATGIP